MRFWKIEGAGNDFVVVDESDGPVQHGSALAVALSDRRLGIGADGLLLVSRAREAGVDAEMRIYNSDGSTARMCGNGLRGVVRWLLETGRASGPEVVVATPAGPRRGRLEPSGAVAVSMGAPSFDPAALPSDLDPGESGLPPVHPLPEGLCADPDVAFAVSVGNPHLVVRVPDAAAVDLGLHARALSTTPRLRDGANVHVVTPEPGGLLRTRTWERGAGPTQACGSGAVAVAVVARALGWCDAGPVRVAMPGGTLAVDVDGSGEAWLSGPARVVFRGEWAGT